MRKGVSFAEDRLTVNITMECVEDVGPAIDFLTDMAGAVWRELVIEDDKIKSYVEANWRSRNGAPSEPVKPRKTPDFSKEPNPQKLDGKVLRIARELKKADMAAIAKRLGLTNPLVAMALERLRKGGHLEGLE